MGRVDWQKLVVWTAILCYCLTALAVAAYFAYRAVEGVPAGTCARGFQADSCFS